MNMNRISYQYRTKHILHQLPTVLKTNSCMRHTNIKRRRSVCGASLCTKSTKNPMEIDKPAL